MMLIIIVALKMSNFLLICTSDLKDYRPKGKLTYMHLKNQSGLCSYIHHIAVRDKRVFNLAIETIWSITS